MINWIVCAVDEEKLYDHGVRIHYDTLSPEEFCYRDDAVVWLSLNAHKYDDSLEFIIKRKIR